MEFNRATRPRLMTPPGKRFLREAALRFVRQCTGSRRRGTNAALNLTSFIDFLVVVVVFLLMSFPATGEPWVRNTRVPNATNTLEMAEAPVVSLVGRQVLVDGALADTIGVIEETGRVQRLDGLRENLGKKRELWMQLNPDRPFRARVLLQIDRDVKAAAVKSVFASAMQAGYSDISFMVERLPRTENP